MQENRKGLELMNENELENVTGGADYVGDVADLAKLEGRRVKVPMSAGACKCPRSQVIDFVFAAKSEKLGGTVYYTDVKCYGCDKTLDVYPPKGRSGR